MGVAQFTAGQSLTALEVNQLPVVVSYLATGSVASSAAETVIGTFTIPAGDPSFPGGYWCYVHGIYTEAATPTLAIRMRFGTLTGTIIANAGPSSMTTTPGTFDILAWFMIESLGTAGTYGCVSQTTITNVPFVTSGSEATAINTTIANNIVVTAQFSASSASNTATTKGGSLYRL